jgi:hypothetical protein
MVVAGLILPDALHLLCYCPVLRVHDLIVYLIELTHPLTHFLLVAYSCGLIACMKAEIGWSLLDV